MALATNDVTIQRSPSGKSEIFFLCNELKLVAICLILQHCINPSSFKRHAPCLLLGVGRLKFLLLTKEKVPEGLSAIAGRMRSLLLLSFLTSP